MVAIKLIALTFLAAVLAAPEAVPNAAPEAIADAAPEAGENGIIRPCPKGKVRCCPGNPACYPRSLCRVMLCPRPPLPSSGVHCCCDRTCPDDPICARVRCRNPDLPQNEEA